MISKEALRPYVASLSAGLVTFGAVHAIDLYLARIKLPAEATILDDLLLGILVGVLILSIELHHQRELRAQQHKIAVIREMNHHVRNALQTILYVTFRAGDTSNSEKVTEAARRIEWALREILPAEPSHNHKEERWPTVPPKSE
jgi:hypothetical protein